MTPGDGPAHDVTAMFQNDDSKAFLVAQLSDCHLLADPQARLRGVAPLAALERVLAALARHAPPVDALLLTGDLSQDGSPESYVLLHAALARFGRPAYALAGNHDDPAALVAAAAPPLVVAETVTLGAWRLLLASTHLPGRVEGGLDAATRARLDTAATEGGFQLLALHHPPAAIGCPWLDAIGLLPQDAAWLARWAAHNPALRLLVHGHAHRVTLGTVAGRPFYGAPSTWRQFRCDGRHHLDHQPPAVRLIRLEADGTHRSWVLFAR